MSRTIVVLLALVVLAPVVVLAEEVTCESRDERRVECPMDTQGAVRMVRQLSKSECIEGTTWGLSKHSVWVEGGCRAVFANEGGSTYQNPSTSGELPTRVTCESRDNKRVECPMDTRGAVRMVKHLSDAKCVEGTTWGLSKHSVWVEDGCRAVFENEGGSTYQTPSTSGELPTRVTCESRDNKRVECPMDTRGAVHMVKHLSDAKCIEGTTWGLSKHSVWVERGCRAVFELEGSGGSHSGNATEPTSHQIAACNKNRGLYGQSVSHTALKPGAWEIILRYDDGDYVCNVEADNRVTYFEKLRR